MTKIRMTRWCVLLLVAVSLAADQSPAAEPLEPDPPRVPPGNVAELGADGLSPLYDFSAAELERILESPKRWQVLPRPISGMWLSPERPPCFEMLPRNYSSSHSAIIRWSAQQDWNGRFRLLHGAEVQAWIGDSFWIDARDFARRANRLEDSQWTVTSTLQSFQMSFDYRGRMYLAIDEQGRWWTAGEKGLYRLQEDQWLPVALDIWPEGRAVSGPVAGPPGRFAVWGVSPNDDPSSGRGPNQRLVTVLRYDHGVWDKVELLRRGPWWHGTYLRDGTLVMAGKDQVAVIPVELPEPAKREEWKDLLAEIDKAQTPQERLKTTARLMLAAAVVPDQDSEAPQESQESQDVIDALTRGWLPLGKGQWAAIDRALATTSDGSIMVSGSKGIKPQQMLVLVIGADGEITTQAVRNRTLAAAYGDDSFVVHVRGNGLYSFSVKSSHWTRLAGDEMLAGADRILGADHKGRIFFGGEEAILMLSPEAPNRDVVQARLFGTVYEEYSAQAAAIDSTGTLWWTDRFSGQLMHWDPSMSWAEPCPDGPESAMAIWPGRNGAILALLRDGEAFWLQSGRVERGESLFELGKQHFQQLQTTAPRATDDPRRLFPSKRRGPGPSPSSPWLTSGDHLWVVQSRQRSRPRQNDVYRISRDGGHVIVNDMVEASGIEPGLFSIMGPLRSGPLVLWRAEEDSLLTKWSWIHNPDSELRLEAIESPPERYGAISLESPARFYEDWHFDRTGCLWLHMGYDRVLRIRNPGEVRTLFDFGIPRFEYPDGTVWGRQDGGVSPGYQVAQGDAHHSVVATYQHSLIPLFAEEEHRVYCLTPDGMAYLEFDSANPQDSKITERHQIAGLGHPVAYIGRTAGLVLLIRDDGGLIGIPRFGSE